MWGVPCAHNPAFFCDFCARIIAPFCLASSLTLRWAEICFGPRFNSFCASCHVRTKSRYHWTRSGSESNLMRNSFCDFSLCLNVKFLMRLTADWERQSGWLWSNSSLHQSRYLSHHTKHGKSLKNRFVYIDWLNCAQYYDVSPYKPRVLICALITRQNTEFKRVKVWFEVAL